MSTQNASAGAQGALFHTSIEDGVAVVTIDDKSAPHNTLTRAFGEEADALFKKLGDDANVTAIVLNVPIAQLGGTAFDTWSTISVAQ